MKVGDEILSVNTVPVTGRRLDDVVISMSVSRRLLLTVRPSATISSETNSSSSLSGLGATDEDEAGSTSTPVVVVRSGSGSTNADEITRYTNGLRSVELFCPLFQLNAVTVSAFQNIFLFK